MSIKLKTFFVQVLIGIGLLFLAVEAYAQYFVDSSFMTSQGTLQEGFETFGDWTVAGTGTLADDTVHVRTGSHAMALTATSGNTASIQKTVSWNFSSVTNFSMWMYTSDKSMFSGNIVIYLCANAGCTNYELKNVSSGAIHNGWNRVVLNRTTQNDFASSSGSWSSIVAFKLQITAKAASDATLVFDDFRSDPVGRAKVIMTYDDNRGDVYTKVYNYMKQYNMPAVDGVITDYVGINWTSDRVYQEATLPQMKEMYAAGWNMVSHTATHVSLAAHNWGVDNQQYEIDSSQAYLRNNGFGEGAYFLIYPGGSYNEIVKKNLQQSGYRMGRTVNASTETHWWMSGGQDGNGADEFDLSSMLAVAQGTTLSAVKSALDRAIVKGQLVVYYLHSVVDTPTVGTEWDYATFTQWIDYVNQQCNVSGLCDVITWSKYWRGFNAGNAKFN